MGKRSDGTGSVYQRKVDGLWVGSLRIDGGKRSYVYGRTRKAVETKLHELRGEVDRGLLPSTITVEQWVRYWLDSISDSRPTSRQTSRNAAEQWIYPHLGRLPLRGLREEHLRVWHDQMRRHRGPRSPQGLSDGTIRRVHSVLQAALTAALNDRRVLRNVATNVNPTPRDKLRDARPHHHDQLTTEESRQLIDATHDPRQRARLVAAFVGLRQSEALALRWESCPPGTLVVAQTVHRIKGRGLVVEDEGKSGRALRTILLGPAFASIVETWRLESGGVGWMFAGHDPEQPEDGRRDYQAWADALSVAGLRHVPLHGARGRAASAMTGQPVRVAADVLGHTQARMTTDVYQRSSEDERRAAVLAIETAVLG